MNINNLEVIDLTPFQTKPMQKVPFKLSTPVTEGGPVVQLKKVKTWQAMEGFGMTAEIWVDGRKVADFLDEGRGGMFRYEVIDQKAWDKLEAYAKSLPPIPCEYIEGESLPMDIDLFIDQVAEDHEKMKLWKKMEKQMVNHIFWGKPNSGSYMAQKFRIPLSAVPIDQLQKAVDKIKAGLKAEEIIYNTNLTDMGIIL